MLLALLFFPAVACYGMACWYSFGYFRSAEEALDRLASEWLSWSLLLQALAFVFLWMQEGYSPLATLSGILNALALALAAAWWLGHLKTPLALLTGIFSPFIFLVSLAAFVEGFQSEAPTDLSWMTPGMEGHIFLTFLGFSLFTLGFGVAVAFWAQENQLKQKKAAQAWSYRLPALETLDGLTVFYTALGFVCWALGFLLGVEQALDVWSKVPFTDPKILGSLLVLVIYSGFFLLRWGFKMRGRKTMTLVLFGYFLALFAFAGVQFLLNTRHDF